MARARMKNTKELPAKASTLTHRSIAEEDGTMTVTTDNIDLTADLD
jgi:hypothetical protein